MQQLSLALALESQARSLVDDETGRIAYTPAVVDAATCAGWFETLRDATPWQHERRPMYDRIVDVPRLVAWYPLDGELPSVLQAARRAVEAFEGRTFNSVGLNLYRDARDSVAMHNDHNEVLVPDSPVVLLSLGSARSMRIQSKARPRTTFSVLLEPGSILSMGGPAQEHWEHGIPKMRADVGPRISLAFRCKVDAAEPARI
jgi:alkylated DNA repair dioxygenase AlkB